MTRCITIVLLLLGLSLPMHGAAQESSTDSDLAHPVIGGGDDDKADSSSETPDSDVQVSAKKLATDPLDQAASSQSETAEQGHSEDWGEWADNSISINRQPVDAASGQRFGVGIEGEDELLLNRLDSSVITGVSAKLTQPDP